MASNPLVSIIVPAYNAADFIADALRSIIRQKLKSFEIVIVNDASTDDTAKECRRLLRKYRGYEIKYEEHTSNKGGGGTRNTCVSISQGNYIFNLDSDNLLPFGLLNQLLGTAESHYQNTRHHAMISPEYLQYFKDERVPLFGNSLSLKKTILLHRWHYDRLDYNFVLTNNRSPASSGNYLYHRSIFESVGGYLEDCGPYDTWSFGIRCYLAGFRYLTVPQTHYLHRLHANSYWITNEKEGANKEYLYKAVCHFREVYSQQSLETLNPNNPDYPAARMECLRLHEHA